MTTAPPPPPGDPEDGPDNEVRTSRGARTALIIGGVVVGGVLLVVALVIAAAVSMTSQRDSGFEAELRAAARAVVDEVAVAGTAPQDGTELAAAVERALGPPSSSNVVLVAESSQTFATAGGFGFCLEHLESLASIAHDSASGESVYSSGSCP